MRKKRLTPRQPHKLGNGQTLTLTGTPYEATQIRAMGNLTHQDVTLIPERNNPYDPNAISVRRCGIKIGYLPKYWATQYTPHIRAIFAAGYLPTTTICHAEDLNIRIRLNKPHELNLPIWITKPRKKFRIPKTYDVAGEFPIPVKAGHPRCDAYEPTTDRGILNFFKRK